ncbi:biotin synthase BioB [Floricoccus penangensis]|uniref:biotin synthase BioB n=1 Tax=Floricoccus penangensis TaxID=1859475 RepID=UPI00203EA7EC|nr:biotin synthase BioB [Floricoccus penangensis]URZ87597.1 biotin synthase BioB [Floricoccus penangensis]
MDYLKLAQEIIDGTREITPDEALYILESTDDWWAIYAGAVALKNGISANEVRLNTLLNAKSGLCAEDCGYCAQSKYSEAEVETYGLIPNDEIIKKALIAKKNHASTFCIAMSGTRATMRELKVMGDALRTIKEDLNLELCVSMGLLDSEQIDYLKSVGVDRVNHNLNTPRDNYDNITTTHSYQDRIDTLDRLNEDDVNICSGFICGMGETDEQLVEMAFDLKEKNPYSVPMNFLLPIDGTKLEGRHELTPLRCLKVVTMIRYLFPRTEIRISAGREYHLAEMQNLGMLLVDSIFLGNYLTEKGDPVEKDIEAIHKHGLKIYEAVTVK